MLLIFTACKVSIEFEDKSGNDTARPDTDADADTDADTDTDTDADTLTAATSWSMPTDKETRWVWTHDLTGDGVEDIFAGYYDPIESWRVDTTVPSGVSFVRAAGGDLYEPIRHVDLGHYVARGGMQAAFGDLDEDGIDDVAVGHVDGFSVFFGTASGALDGPHDVLGEEGTEVALGDYDGDGHLDATACSASGVFVAWRGAGDGSFTEDQRTTCGWTQPLYPRSSLVDLDGDTWPDHIRRVIQGDTYDTLEVLWNDGGTFTPPRGYRLPEGVGATTFVGDFVIMPSLYADPGLVIPAEDQDSMTTYTLEDRDLRMVYQNAVPQSGFPYTTLVKDADRDGTLDLVTVTETPGRPYDYAWSEAGFYDAYGQAPGTYYPNEWELRGGTTAGRDLGYAILTADRPSLSPIVMAATDENGLSILQLVEAETSL